MIENPSAGSKRMTPMTDDATLMSIPNNLRVFLISTDTSHWAPGTMMYVYTRRHTMIEVITSRYHSRS